MGQENKNLKRGNKSFGPGYYKTFAGSRWITLLDKFVSNLGNLEKIELLILDIPILGPKIVKKRKL